MHWVSTDVRHFVQNLTPRKEDGNGVIAGLIEDEAGDSIALYEKRQDNPPMEYHIQTDGETVTDWIVREDGSIEDRREMPLTTDHKVHIFDAIVSVMLVPAN